MPPAPRKGAKRHSSLAGHCTCPPRRLQAKKIINEKARRLVSIGIGVFFLAGSYWMKQMDYYNMFVVLVCAMWEGGAGAIMTFGLYTRVGTTAGAWTALVTRGDKAIAWGVFLWSFVYGFCLAFVGVVIWNAIHPWPVRWWCWYFVIQFFIVPCAMACVTTVWFGVGGFIGLRQLFRDLAARKETNDLDDGRVEGHVSLADKQALEAVDRESE